MAIRHREDPNAQRLPFYRSINAVRRETVADSSRMREKSKRQKEEKSDETRRERVMGWIKL